MKPKGKTGCWGKNDTLTLPQTSCRNTGYKYQEGEKISGDLDEFCRLASTPRSSQACDVGLECLMWFRQKRQLAVMLLALTLENAPWKLGDEGKSRFGCVVLGILY